MIDIIGVIVIVRVCESQGGCRGGIVLLCVGTYIRGG